MASPNAGQDEQAELTPEARLYIGKARRSFGLSIAILMAGLIAVAFAIVYRVTRDIGPDDSYVLQSIAVPQGAEVISAVPSQGMVAVTYRNGRQTMLRLVDGKTGDVLRDIPIAAD